MARVAKKKTVNNTKGLLSAIDVDKRDVEKVVDFGRFIVVVTKDGVIYHTHIGLEIRCKMWLLNTDGKAVEGSLCAWLLNLVAMKEESEGKESELYPYAGTATYGDILDYMVIMTEANLQYPIVAFTDMKEATEFAEKRLNWLGDMLKKLEEVSGQPVKEEAIMDMKANFEHGASAILGEQAESTLKERTEG
jgi:hypothetical protein